MSNMKHEKKNPIWNQIHISPSDTRETDRQTNKQTTKQNKRKATFCSGSSSNFSQSSAISALSRFTCDKEQSRQSELQVAIENASQSHNQRANPNDSLLG